MNVDRVLNGLIKLAMAAALVGAAALAVTTALDRLTLDRQAAERRALVQRHAELNIGALAPGSALACLDGGAGEAVENACEKQVFADPQSTAAAVAYMAARLALLAEASAFEQNAKSDANSNTAPQPQAGEPNLNEAFAATRRAIELDRFGIAAHVLAQRDGCTAAQCAAFALLRDSAVLKANLRAQAFDTYVARYAGRWNETEPAVPVAAAPAAQPAPVAGAPEQPTAGLGQPVASKYTFPSSASIPPVSIMNAEPALPKGAGEARAAQSENDDASVPVPPKRPAAQAASPPVR